VRRAAAAILVLAVAVLSVTRLRAAAAHPRPPGGRAPSAGTGGLVAPAAASIAPTLFGAGVAAPGTPSARADAAAVARRWVSAMWTRPPGASPFAWLDQVADITTVGLVARLRSALPAPVDPGVVSSRVDIDAAYPSAVDPDVVTVTCVAHLATTTGLRDEPCATTVTVTPAPGGRLLVSAAA
jgi:hypothetical protein